MGKAQKDNEDKRAELLDQGRQAIERQMGPVLEHNAHSNGCPKCGAPDQVLKKRYHPGYRDFAPQDMCSLRDEHLHGVCPCGFEWREQVADSRADDRRLPCAQIGETGERIVVDMPAQGGLVAVGKTVDV
jgi:hypothetical protein